jgi:hypothetical protein
MNTFASAVLDRATTTRTENGDKAFTTSLDSCVDMFFKIAAVRGRGSQVVINMFDQAYASDPDIATRIALWARDVREGAGERQVFRDVLKHLEKKDTARLERILPIVPELGRWDDLFVFETKFIKDQVLGMFAYALRDGNGLAAKWAPREGSANKEFAKSLREYMSISPREYRKLISSLSKTVEQNMCAKEWDDINFSHVPSVASARYSKAFWKHQPERYGQFVQKAEKGEVKINAKALFPYDITKSTVDHKTANALWNQLPDFVPEGVSFIPVIDTSSSMDARVGDNSNVSCIDVSVSLGIYLAQRNKTAFKNLALTFNSTPKWINIPHGLDIHEIVEQVRRASWGGSTNLDASMDLILDVAIKNRVPADDMPKYLVVISDMEFNVGWSGGNTSVAERTLAKFRAAGYEAPVIVWWNVQSRAGTTPVRYDASGMVMVSGCSPTVTKTVLGGETNPKSAMLATVMADRYNH